MPAAASSTARPSRTNANANTSTQAVAKNSVVVSTSQLRASMAKSFRSTSQAVRRNMSGRSDERAVARAQARARRFVGDQPAVAHQRNARDEAVGQIQVMRGEHDDGAGGGELTQAIRHQPHGTIVQTC